MESKCAIDVHACDLRVQLFAQVCALACLSHIHISSIFATQLSLVKVPRIVQAVSVSVVCMCVCVCRVQSAKFTHTYEQMPLEAYFL